MAYNFDNVSAVVADDNRYMRGLIKDILQTFGMRMIYEALDGDRAFELCKEHVPDIVIADWFMEPTDGLTLTRLLRRHPSSPNPYVPIVMITGFADLERVTEARDAGVTEFVVKPFTARAIYTRLVEVIERPRSFIRTPTYFGPDRRRKLMEDYAGPERRKTRPRAVTVRGVPGARRTAGTTSSSS